MNSIVLDSFKHMFLLQPIYNFNVIKVNKNTTARTAWNIGDFVSLNCDLDILIGCDEWKLEVEAWIGDTIEQSSSSVINAHMTLLYDVEAIEENQKNGKQQSA